MSAMLAFNFNAPACTVHSPLASGSVSTTALAFRFTSSTVSPTFAAVTGPPSPLAAICSELASMAPCSWARRACSSCSFTPPARCFFRSEMICSLSRWAFCSSCRASCLALRSSVSRRAASSFCSRSASSRSFWVSMWACSASSRSFSAICRWYSALAITSSNRTVSLLRRPLASSIRNSGRPSFREISKALDLPGTPMDSR